MLQRFSHRLLILAAFAGAGASAAAASVAGAVAPTPSAAAAPEIPAVPVNPPPAIVGPVGEVPPLLDIAIQTWVKNDNRWAYTLTTQRYNRSGKPDGGTTIETFDPSRPYAEQWHLNQYFGHVPTDHDRAVWKRSKDREVKRREEKSFGDLLDLDRATLTGADADTATYDVPIMKDASRRVPVDKLRMIMVVDRRLQALRSFAVRPKEPFHVAGTIGMFKVDAGVVEARFEVVQPDQAPPLVSLNASGSGHLFGIIRLGLGADLHYSDFRRVKPYEERFGVRIGDMKALNF